MKRMISCLVVAALVPSTVSCYRTEHIRRNGLGRANEIVVVMPNGGRQEFRTGGVVGSDFVGRRPHGSTATIPISAIDHFEVKVYDEKKTLFTVKVVGYSAGAVAALIALICAIAGRSSSGGSGQPAWPIFKI